jgi:hypothetical protein
MNQDAWIDIIAEIDEAMEHESSRLIVLVGSDASGKTALCACWKKQHILKYAEFREGERLDMVIHLLNFSLRMPRPHLISAWCDYFIAGCTQLENWSKSD